MFLRLLVANVLFLASLPALLRGAPGEPDAAHDVRCSSVGAVRAMARQADGRVLIGGDFVFVNGVRRPSVARLNADGSVDTGFNAGDGNPYSYYSQTIHALLPQPDGKILVGGYFTEFNGLPVNNLIRLNADGSRDFSFGSVVISRSYGSVAVYALALGDDGKILVGGAFDSVQGVSKTHLARLNSDGTLDATFTTTANNIVYAIVPEPGGSWLIGGSFGQIGGVARAALARLQADGSVNAAFVPPALQANADVYGISLMADGRILYGGYQPVTISAVGFLRRVQGDGTADATFAPPTFGGARVENLTTLGDGSILLGGYFSTVNGVAQNAIVRLAADGTPFPLPQQNADYAVFVFLPLPNGTVIFGGSQNRMGQDLRFGLGLFRADGTLDPDFHPDATISSSVRKIAKISGGRWIVAGGFDGILSGTIRNRQYRLARLDGAAQPDSQFPVEFPGNYFAQFIAAAEQSDGRVVAAKESNSLGVRDVYRFNTDGSLDTGFTATIEPYSSYPALTALAVQPDDKVILGGNMTVVNGSHASPVSRLLADGSLDTSFASNALGTPYDLAVLARGKIVAVGSNYVVRFQPDGRYDASFDGALSVNGPVYAVAILPGQRLLIAGDFTTVNGQASGRVARLLPNGILDPTFNAGTGADAAVRAVAVRSDGEIFLTGDFLNFSGNSRRRLAQLAPDGAVRTAFDPGLGLDASGYTLAVEAGGSLLVGGAFTAVNGLARFGLARVETTAPGIAQIPPPTVSSFSATAVAASRVLLVWGAVPSADGFIVERSTDGVSGWLSLGSLGAGATSFADATTAPGQTCYYRVTAWNAGGDAPVSAIRPVTLPAPDTLAGAVLPGNALDLWTRGDVRAVARQADGRLILAGRFTRVNGVARVNVVRLNVDGSLDTTFDTGPGADVIANAVAIQPDGKIVVGGGSAGIKPAPGFVERYLPDGTRDPAFSPAVPSSTSTNAAVKSLLILPDGRILIGGGFLNVGTAQRGYLARLNADGSYDASYGGPSISVNSSFANGVSALALQSDGRILLGGDFSSIRNSNGTGSKSTQVARISTSGAVDATFASVSLIQGTGARFLQGIVFALELQGDGKVLVGGTFNRIGTQTLNGILRLTTAGAVDATFNAGTGASASVYALAQFGDGRIAVGGNFQTFAGSSRTGFAVLSGTGALQGGDLAIFPNDVRAVLPLAGGQCVAGGPFHSLGGSRRQSVAQIMADGNTADATFAASLSYPGQAYGMVSQGDGKTVIIGDFTAVGRPDDLGIPRYDVLRLNADDSVDAGFSGTIGFAGVARAVAVGTDGKTWTGGDFTGVGFATRNRIARLLANGSMDTAFDPAAGLASTVNALVPEDDGGVTVGGAFTTAAGQTRNRLARFDAAGALTADFNGLTGNTVNALSRQPDGKLIVASTGLTRLNADGTSDTAFSAAPDSSVTKLILLGDGRQLVAGFFSNIGGAPRKILARLHPTGLCDVGFSHLLTGSSVSQIVSTGDGGCIAMGWLEGPIAYRTLGVARFFPDGSVDPAFDAGVFTGNSPVAGAVSAERVLIGGSFQNFAGQPRIGLVRLRAASSATVPAAVSAPGITALSAASASIAWSDVGGESGYVVERSPASTTAWQAIAALGADQTSYTDTGLAAGSTWRYRVSAFNAAGSSVASGALAVTLPSSFAQWRLAAGIAPGMFGDTDLDGDGLGIFAEYALGLSPWIPDAGQASSVSLVNGRLQLTYFRAQIGVTYVVQTSVNLQDWSTDGVDQGGPGPWVTASLPFDGTPGKFLRILMVPSP